MLDRGVHPDSQGTGGCALRWVSVRRDRERSDPTFYAECDDGTRIDNSRGTFLCLPQQRTELVNAMETARIEIEAAGATEASVAEAMQEDSQVGFLQTDLSRGGVRAVLTRLKGFRRFEM